METSTSRNRWLQQKYYNKDDLFYSHNIRTNCMGQAKYHTLRKWEMDYFLVFCEDINAQIYEVGNIIRLFTNNFDYNNLLCKYKCVTKNYQDAEKIIDQILEMGNMVVFKTAMDYLHTYIWYHKEGPYKRVHHYSIIVGCDADDYFYLDVPGIRNPQYFRAHPENEEIGKIDKKELLQSFEFCCEIGYIEVNENYIKNIAGINKILQGIVQNYYQVNETSTNCVGRQALEKLIYILRNKSEMEKFSLDEFRCILFASRHRLLGINIQKHDSCIRKDKIEKCIKLLDEIAGKWEVISNMVIKHKKRVYKDDNIGERVARIIEKYIIPMTDELMYYFKCSFEDV